jgi:hypothetical protein
MLRNVRAKSEVVVTKPVMSGSDTHWHAKQALVEVVIVQALLLRSIQSLFCTRDKRVRRLRRLVLANDKGHADRRLVRQLKRLDEIPQFPTDMASPHSLRLRQDDGKVGFSYPADEIGHSYGLSDKLCDSFEDIVSTAESVIHLPEIVYVPHQQTQWRFIPPNSRYFQA